MRILSEKNDIEAKLCQEVEKKQKTVLTLEKQKMTLAKELQQKLHELHSYNSARKSETPSDALEELKMSGTDDEEVETSEQEDDDWVFDLLRRDRHYLDSHINNITNKIMNLSAQIEQTTLW